GDVALATDRRGQNIYLAFINYGRCGDHKEERDDGDHGEPDARCGSETPGAVMFTRAGAGTSTFDPPRAVDDHPYRGMVDRPWLRAGDNDEVYLSYDDFVSNRRPNRKLG